MNAKPSLLVAIPFRLYSELFSPESDKILRSLSRVSVQPETHDLTSEELACKLPGVDIVITGWGTPVFSGEVLAAADQLKLIAHSAGSIKRMLPPPVFARGIEVTHAASAIAPAVVEMTLLLILTCLRQTHKLDRHMRSGDAWPVAKSMGLGEELAGKRVGVVGAGYIGRLMIGLLRTLGCEVMVFDPYLSEERAAALGARKAALDNLFAQCAIVTLQAPGTQETHHMVGARQLKLLQDGAILINTARPLIVEQEALLAELRTGRIQAAIDVFEQEPLPPDSPFLELDNVVLTPHIGAATRQARLRQGRTITEEIERFLAGVPLLYGVTGDMLETMG